MKPTIKPKRTAEQRAEEEAVRRQHAENPVRQRPAGAINRQSFTAILTLVARFKTLRASQGLTLAEVAERMGIDAPALSRLETGKMLNPTLATLHKWAEALGQKLEVTLSPASEGEPTMIPSDSKARLFACRCVREVEHLLLDPRSLRAVEVAEQFANGLGTQEGLQQAAKEAAEAAGLIAKQHRGSGRALAAEAACWTAAEAAAQAELEAPKLAARAAASEATAAGTRTSEAFEVAEMKASERQAKIRTEIFGLDAS